MPDGRRNNRGTKGNKGGRPPKLDEVRKFEMMDKVAKPEIVLAALYKKVEEGDTQAIKAWLDHRLGKAKESKDIEITGEGVKQYIIKGAKGNINK